MQPREYCYDCGRVLRPTRKQKLMVNVDNASGRVIPPDATPEPWRMGLAGCRQGLREEGTQSLPH